MRKQAEIHDTILWTPRSREDQLLSNYLAVRRGSLFLEVPIGGRGASEQWPVGATPRRIDGVILGFSNTPVSRFNSASEIAFRDLLPVSFIELVEVKTALDRSAIGQAVAARRMFPRHYGYPASRVVIVCSRINTALEWVCKEEGIVVVRQPKPEPLKGPAVSELFAPEPEQWGLRGDPWLWREMKEALSGSNLPPDVDSLRALLLQTFEMLVGTDLLGPKTSVDVPRYEHVGISGGQVSVQFWKEVGMPILLKRAQEFVT